MLEVFTGPPGSGKSLHMAKQINEYIARRKYVICNLDIALPKKQESKKHKLFCVENEDITPKFLRAFAEKYHEPRKEKQTLIVIDECQLKFSHSFMTKGKARLWLEFFSQHRKLGFDLLLVTPSMRTGIVREIRDNLEMETTHLKLTNYPTKSIIFGLILLIIQLSPINIFMSISKWRGLPDKRYYVKHLFLYSPKYGKMYDTFKIYDTDTDRKKPVDILSGADRGGGGGEVAEPEACRRPQPRSARTLETASYAVRPAVQTWLRKGFDLNGNGKFLSGSNI